MATPSNPRDFIGVDVDIEGQPQSWRRSLSQHSAQILPVEVTLSIEFRLDGDNADVSVVRAILASFLNRLPLHYDRDALGPSSVDSSSSMYAMMPGRLGSTR